MRYLSLAPVNETSATLQDRAARSIATSNSLRLRGLIEEAREEISYFWCDVGADVRLDGLSEATRADLLLLVGSLTREIVRRRRTAGGQANAIKLLSRSFATAVKLPDPVRQADALAQLAYVFVVMGRFAPARRLLKRAEPLAAGDVEVLARVRLNMVLRENYDLQPAVALRIADESAELFDESRLLNHTLIGNFHSARGIARLAYFDESARPDDLYRSYMDMEAARYHYEVSGHTAHHAGILNNLAFLSLRSGDYVAALDTGLRARVLMEGAGDAVEVAQIDDTLARIYLACGDPHKARECIERAKDVFERTNSSHLLAEARAVEAQIESPAPSRNTYLRIVRRDEIPRPSNAFLSSRPGDQEMVSLQLSEDDRSLAAFGYEPGDAVDFMPRVQPREGELTALYHLRDQAYYIGFYHGDPTCICHLDKHGEPQDIITLCYATSPPRDFRRGDVSIIGTHPFLRGQTC